MTSTLIHLGVDQIPHVEQSPTLTEMSNIRGDMLQSLVTGTFGPVPIYKKKMGTAPPIQSTVVQNQ